MFLFLPFKSNLGYFLIVKSNKKRFLKFLRQKKGVEVASSMNPDNHSKKLVYIKYKDHILFKHVNPRLYFDVVKREAVGWMIYETNEFLCILNDRSVQPIPNEACESGFSLLKSNIIETREIK
ncbi:MAG: hypothetical protein QG670_1925 [Thermoproteota archaeon]|nr:hypothetical protein [Thermoproteota archaeon]